METSNTTEATTEATDEGAVRDPREQLLEDAYSKAFEEASVAARKEFAAFREATTDWPVLDDDKALDWLNGFTQAKSATRRLVDVASQQSAGNAPIVDAQAASLARIYVFHPALSELPIFFGPDDVQRLLFCRVAVSRGVPVQIILDANSTTKEFVEFMLTGEDLLGVDYDAAQKGSG